MYAYNLTTFTTDTQTLCTCQTAYNEALQHLQQIVKKEHKSVKKEIK